MLGACDQCNEAAKGMGNNDGFHIGFEKACVLGNGHLFGAERVHVIGLAPIAFAHA